MGIDKHQLRRLISETLQEIELYSEEAVKLLMGTAAQESGLGTYLRQLRNGPALGIFQIEPATFKDLFENYLFKKPDLFNKVKTFAIELEAEEMVWNLKFAIVMARIFYLRMPGSLPTTLNGMAKYYKQYYNTPLGAGTEEEFINNYKKYVL